MSVLVLVPPFLLPSCPLTVSSSLSGQEMTIAVAGEADWATADLLERQLVAALTPEVVWLVLDLAELTFCNLRGLGALHEAVEVARRCGIDVTVRGMSRQLSRLHDTFPERLASVEGASDGPGVPFRGHRRAGPAHPAPAWAGSDTA